MSILTDAFDLTAQVGATFTEPTNAPVNGVTYGPATGIPQNGIVTAPNSPQVEMAAHVMNYPTVNVSSGATLDTSNVLQVSQSLQQVGIGHGHSLSITHDNTQHTVQSTLEMQQPQPGMQNGMMG